MAGAALSGCGKSKDTKNASQSQPATAPAMRAQYSFADPATMTQHPAAAAFVTSFLETCMTGDYLAYRNLVSRYEQPESRERFEAIYKNLRSIVVESIDVLPPEKRGLWHRATSTAPATGDVYLVVSTVNFDPNANIALRHRNRQVAILAFREGGEWRMCPAPASLQPDSRARDGDPATQASASTQASRPAPEFPWDQDGDY